MGPGGMLHEIHRAPEEDGRRASQHRLEEEEEQGRGCGLARPPWIFQTRGCHSLQLNRYLGSLARCGAQQLMSSLRCIRRCSEMGLVFILDYADEDDFYRGDLFQLQSWYCHVHIGDLSVQLVN